MFTEAQGKPLRGIISDVQYSNKDGRVTAKLASPDFLQGQEGRNEIVQGRSIRTSRVESFDVVEGQLVVITANSAYVVEGAIGVWEVTLEQSKVEWPECTPYSRSMTGLES